MKKILSLILVCATTGIISAQTQEMNKWSLSYGFGTHFWTKPEASKANLRNKVIGHHDFNVRYMFNNRIGLMLNANYDKLEFGGLGNPHPITQYLNFTLQSVINLGDILKVYTLQERFGLLAHAGLGYGVMWQTEPTRSEKDKMVALTAGLTPQLRLTDHWSIKADVSLQFNYKQNYAFDFQRKLNHTNWNFASLGGFLTTSLGVTYYIGKNEKHADWTQSNNKDELAAVYERLAQAEEKVNELSEKVDQNTEDVAGINDALKDDDNDGVPNSRDNESNTPEGKLVNSFGEAIEMDTEKEEATTQADKIVLFNQGKASILEDSKDALNSLAEQLKNDPSKFIMVEGHASIEGSEEVNQRLSKQRAESVKKYLVSQGVNGDQVSTVGFGSSRPIVSNATEEGKMKNRRVEIYVK